MPVTVQNRPVGLCTCKTIRIPPIWRGAPPAPGTGWNLRRHRIRRGSIRPFRAEVAPRRALRPMRECYWWPDRFAQEIALCRPPGPPRQRGGQGWLVFFAPCGSVGRCAGRGGDRKHSRQPPPVLVWPAHRRALPTYPSTRLDELCFKLRAYRLRRLHPKPSPASKDQIRRMVSLETHSTKEFLANPSSRTPTLAELCEKTCFVGC